MLSLKSLDSESFIIRDCDAGCNYLTFERDQLNVFLKSCLSQKKNVLFIKKVNNEQSISDILNACYANKEKMQDNDHFCFLPHRLKKQIEFNL